jgi:hypothetical protein
MKHLLGTCIVWLSIAATAVGLVGFGALSFLYGPDTGGPTNILAGVIMLRWVLQTPLAWMFFGLFILGVLGIAGGSSLVNFGRWPAASA